MSPAHRLARTGTPHRRALVVDDELLIRWSLSETLTEMQHDLGERVVSTLHVHLDHDHCLEVIVLRGPAGVIQQAADRLLATKGVEHGKLGAGFDAVADGGLQ